MTIAVRWATSEDSAGIAHVQITSYRTAYAPFFPQAYLDHFTIQEQTSDWHTLLDADEPDPVLVAVTTEGTVVGYALGDPAPEGLAAQECELVALHVLPEWQRQGIGSRMFSAMVAEFRRRGKTGLWLWTLAGNPVRRFYERLGGELAADKQYAVDEVTVTEVAYRWQNLDELIRVLSRETRTAETKV